MITSPSTSPPSPPPHSWLPLQFIAAAEAAGPCPDPAAAAQLQAAAELAHSSGLAGAARSGVLVCNGVVSTNDGSGGWQGVTMGAVQGQMQAVQEDVYMGRLGGGTADLYEGGWVGCGVRGEGRGLVPPHACMCRWLCMRARNGLILPCSCAHCPYPHACF